MGRKRKSDSGSGEKEKKRKKVTVRLLDREHAGKVTEPYRIMEEIVARDRADLKDVKLAIAWRMGWRANCDGLLKLGQCKKRGELDRELDNYDFVILLNHEAWPTLDATQKEALVFHELCHAQISMDSDGEPKRDDRDRLVCRVRKHDVEDFRAVVEKYGCWTQDLEKIAQAGIADAKRPLLKESDKATVSAGSVAGDAASPGGGAGAAPAAREVKGAVCPNCGGTEFQDDGDCAKCFEPPAAKDKWRYMLIDTLGLSAKLTETLVGAGCETLGKLADRMNNEWWHRDIKGIGPGKVNDISDAFIAFWTKHPEFCVEEEVEETPTPPAPDEETMIHSLEDFREGRTTPIEEVIVAVAEAASEVMSDAAEDVL